MEINQESTRIGLENKAVSQEYAAIKLLKDQNPLDPEIARRTALNKARASEINRCGRENGDRRRALKLELSPEGADNGPEDEIQELNKAVENFDDFFADTHAPTYDNDHGSIPNMLGCDDTRRSSINTVPDPYRQSYASAPGYQSHSPSFQAGPVQSATTISDALPENKIHPARLSLMNSNAPIPVHYFTEPKVLMKVTGENMVPLARSRLAGRETKTTSKQEQDTSEPEEIQEVLPSWYDSYAKKRNTRNRTSPALKKEIFDNTSLPSMQDKGFKSEEAIAWLDANIPLKEASVSDTRFPGEFNMSPRHDDYNYQEQTKPGCFHVPMEQSDRLKVMTDLGLQCYHDDDDDTASEGEISEAGRIPSTAGVCLGQVDIKQELNGTIDLEPDTGSHPRIKRETITEYSQPSEQSRFDNIVIKQDPSSEHQHAASRMQNEDMAISERQPNPHDHSKTDLEQNPSLKNTMRSTGMSALQLMLSRKS